ncbi:SH3 domain-containing protein [Mariprofundus sp. KV]|uniref:SH3 domain-containing protein n=1 Tax=Mariprofundus sp. KV TaxID=2608715 RepID=UPI0015A3B9FE|nr:SH3 domain-containing protein [Mariprofundus sp. KV]
MSRSDSEIEHQGADLREQLHAIVNSEMDLFADVDKIAEVSQLQAEVSQFMANLQQRFDDYILEIERENASAAERAEDDAVEAALAATATEHAARDNEEIMNLEKEFGTYGIRQANGIFERKRSTRETIIQTLAGATIAVALMWVFWPASEQRESATAVTEVAVEVAQPAIVATAEENTATVEAKVVEALIPAKEEVAVQPEAVVVEPEQSAKPVIVAKATAPAAVEEVVAPEMAEAVISEEAEKVAAAIIKGERIKVTAHFGNVRSAPDNSGKVVSRLKKGEVVYKLEEKDGWYRVRLDAEKTAWVHKSLFAPRMRVGVDVANIRTVPSGNGKIVTRLKKGDYVTKTGEQKGWYQVKLDSGKTAWAHSSIF